MSTNQEEAIKQFDRLKDEYEKIREEMNEKPMGDHREGFNEKAYKHETTLTARRDLLLAQMIALKQPEIDFASVEEKEGKYHIVYNPYRSCLKQLDTMRYDIIPALPLKPKSIAIYQEACKGRIVWLARIMSGPIEQFFNFRLSKWIERDGWKSKKSEFAKDVAVMMKFNPHVKCYKYLNYIKLFVEWISKLEKDDRAIIELVQSVMESLASLLYREDAEKYTRDGTRNARIESLESFPDWKSCSYYCDKYFSDIDFKSYQTIISMEAFKTRFMLEKARRQMEAEKNEKAKKNKNEEEEEEQQQHAAPAPAFSNKRRAEENAEGDDCSKRLKTGKPRRPVPFIDLDALLSNTGDEEKQGEEKEEEENGDDNLGAFRAFQKRIRVELAYVNARNEILAKFDSNAAQSESALQSEQDVCNKAYQEMIATLAQE